jgi:hypothetical protein
MFYFVLPSSRLIIDGESQFIAVRKTLEANMQMANMYPPGRVLWAMRDSDLHPSHRKPTGPASARSPASSANNKGPEDKLRLFEVLDVERVFSQIVFARDMLRFVFPFPSRRIARETDVFGCVVRICRTNMTAFCMICYDNLMLSHIVSFRRT